MFIDHGNHLTCDVCRKQSQVSKANLAIKTLTITAVMAMAIRHMRTLLS